MKLKINHTKNNIFIYSIMLIVFIIINIITNINMKNYLTVIVPKIKNIQATNNIFSSTEIYNKLGDLSKISGISDGTVTSAINETKEKLNNVINIPDVVKTEVIKNDFATGEGIIYIIPKSGYYKLHSYNGGANSSVPPSAYMSNETESIIYDIDIGESNTGWPHASTEFLYFKAGTKVKLRAIFNAGCELLYTSPITNS